MLQLVPLSTPTAQAVARTLPRKQHPGWPFLSSALGHFSELVDIQCGAAVPPPESQQFHCGAYVVDLCVAHGHTCCGLLQPSSVPLPSLYALHQIRVISNAHSHHTIKLRFFERCSWVQAKHDLRRSRSSLTHSDPQSCHIHTPPCCHAPAANHAIFGQYRSAAPSALDLPNCPHAVLGAIWFIAASRPHLASRQLRHQDLAL